MNRSDASAKEPKLRARTLLFDMAVELMEAGDYSTSQVFLRLSALLGNHDSALRNLYDQAQEEERWFRRFLKTSFYRILLSLFNPNRLFWVKNRHGQRQMIWINAVDIRCPECGALNERANLEETDGWLECKACKRRTQVVKDGSIKHVPLIRPIEER